MTRLAAAAALAVFFAAIAVIAIVSASTGGGGGPSATTTTPPAPTPPRRTTPKPPKPSAIHLTGVGSYDPEGDRHENDALAPLAVDGNPSTFWKTEHYLHGFAKSGVGLVLDAGRVRRVAKVVVVTDSPGAFAEIRLGDSPTGPFRPVSANRPLNGRTAFPLAKDARGRYLVVWITQIPEPAGEAHVAEVRAEG